MSKWLVHISGDDVDLAALSDSLAIPELSVNRQDSGYVLTSTLLNDVEAVRTKAAELLEWISGAAGLGIHMRRPLQMGAVVCVREDGLRDIYVSVEPAVLEIRGWASLVVTEADGTIRTVTPVARPLSLALNDPKVGRVLSLYGLEPSDPVNLYRIFEIIESDVGDISMKDWCSKASVERFTRTVNSPTAMGKEARHGIERYNPPKDPMTLSEVNAFIEVLLKKWLESKRP